MNHVLTVAHSVCRRVSPRPHAVCVIRRRFTSESRQFRSWPACSRLSSTELRNKSVREVIPFSLFKYCSNIHSFDSNNTFATETTLACSAPHCHGSREVSISECNVLLRRVEVHRYCVLATTIHTISHVTFLAFYYSIISILYTLVQYP